MLEVLSSLPLLLWLSWVVVVVVLLLKKDGAEGTHLTSAV